MRHATGSLVIALSLLAGIGSSAHAQGTPATPIHVHRETSPHASAQIAEIGDRVKLHLQQMEAAPPSTLFYKGPPLAYGVGQKAMVATHSRLVSTLLDRCTAGMLASNPDPLHEAQVNAVRQDLAQLRELRSGEINAFLPRHTARVKSLLEMHWATLGS